MIGTIGSLSVFVLSAGPVLGEAVLWLIQITISDFYTTSMQLITSFFLHHHNIPITSFFNSIFSWRNIFLHIIYSDCQCYSTYYNVACWSSLCELICVSVPLCLKGFISWVSSNHSGSYNLSFHLLFIMVSLVQGERFNAEIPFRTVCSKVSHSSCRSLWLFPSTVERNLSEDGGTKHWYMSIAEYH